MVGLNVRKLVQFDKLEYGILCECILSSIAYKWTYKIWLLINYDNSQAVINRKQLTSCDHLPVSILDFVWYSDLENGSLYSTFPFLHVTWIINGARFIQL